MCASDMTSCSPAPPERKLLTHASMIVSMCCFFKERYCSFFWYETSFYVVCTNCVNFLTPLTHILSVFFLPCFLSVSAIPPRSRIAARRGSIVPKALSSRSFVPRARTALPPEKRSPATRARGALKVRECKLLAPRAAAAPPLHRKLLATRAPTALYAQPRRRTVQLARYATHQTSSRSALQDRSVRPGQRAPHYVTPTRA